MIHQNTEKLLFNVEAIAILSSPLLAGYDLELWSNPFARFRNPEIEYDEYSKTKKCGDLHGGRKQHVRHGDLFATLKLTQLLVNPSSLGRLNPTMEDNILGGSVNDDGIVNPVGSF